MAKHSSEARSAAMRTAGAEAKRRAVSVARFGLVITLSVAVAFLIFGGHRLPLP